MTFDHNRNLVSHLRSLYFCVPTNDVAQFMRLLNSITLPVAIRVELKSEIATDVPMLYSEFIRFLSCCKVLEELAIHGFIMTRTYDQLFQFPPCHPVSETSRCHGQPGDSDGRLRESATSPLFTQCAVNWGPDTRVWWWFPSGISRSEIGSQWDFRHNYLDESWLIVLVCESLSVHRWSERFQINA
jgi:hypothetical protein